MVAAGETSRALRARSVMIDALGRHAAAIMQQPGYAFADLAQVFAELDASSTARLLNGLMTELLQSADGSDPYYNRVHLVAQNDFNLSLEVTGARARSDGQLCASEFEMIVVNLAQFSVSIPLYRTEISVDALHERPARLAPPERKWLPPHVPCVFRAYAETADLDAADRESAFFVVHSRARGTMTWVYDRATREPLHLTANHLQSSRVQMAAHLVGEIGGAEAIDTLERIARSNEIHFVRWEAAEAVYKLDAERGRGLVEHLIEDPHPSIRKAARATLDNILGQPAVG